MQKTHVAAMVRPEIKTALENQAKEEGRTISNLIERLLIQALEWQGRITETDEEGAK